MDEAMKEVQMVVEAFILRKPVFCWRRNTAAICRSFQVNQVLFDGKSPKEALADLMMRDPRIESSDLPWEG